MQNEEWAQRVNSSFKNIDRAMQNQIEHSPIGADDAHVVFGESMTREHVNTPELQEALRKVFILRLHRDRERGSR